MGEDTEVRTRRVHLTAWNAACRAVGGDSEGLAEDDWALLIAEGLASTPSTLNTRWHGLIASYLNTRLSVRCAAAFSGQLHRATMAVGPASVCVLERRRIETQSDGSLLAVERDELLEVSVTLGQPWLLMQRFVPPLETLRAPARETSRRSAKPVALAEATRERLRRIIAENPDSDPIALLNQHGSDEIRDLLAVDDATVAYLMTAATGERAVLGAGWYNASPRQLFRATFRADPPWEEVRPGDLAFSFQWHLMGALDALGVAGA